MKSKTTSWSPRVIVSKIWIGRWHFSNYWNFEERFILVSSNIFFAIFEYREHSCITFTSPHFLLFSFIFLQVFCLFVRLTHQWWLTFDPCLKGCLFSKQWHGIFHAISDFLTSCLLSRHYRVVITEYSK